MAVGLLVKSVIGGAGFFAGSELFNFWTSGSKDNIVKKPAVVIGTPAASVRASAGGGIAISRTAAILGGLAALAATYWALTK